MPRKEPYTGDPNATLTICYKKRRRHLPSDLLYIPIPTPEGEEAPKTPKIKIICKHCDQNPVVDISAQVA